MQRDTVRAHCLNNAAKEENSFKVELRVHGVSQDDIYKEMQNSVDRLQDGYRDKSIIKDLKQEGVSSVFREDQSASYKRRATSSCTNSAKQSEQLSVLRACDIPKKGHFTADVVSV